MSIYDETLTACIMECEELRERYECLVKTNAGHMDELQKAFDQVKTLAVLNAELLKELQCARQYVEANHAVIASAIGHKQTIIKPDLDRIDAVIAKTEKLK